MTAVSTAYDIVKNLHPLYLDGAITSVKRDYPSLVITASQRDLNSLFDVFMELATVKYKEELQCSDTMQALSTLTDIACEFCSKYSAVWAHCGVRISQDEASAFVADFINFIAINQCTDYAVCPDDLCAQKEEA